VRRYFAGAATVDVDQMLDAWTDDLVYEEAFSDPPRRIEGKDALRPYFSKAGEAFRMSLEITAVHECVAPDELILEYVSNGKSSRPVASCEHLHRCVPLPRRRIWSRSSTTR
jgi:ketosteroid isomerase-like protein